MKKGDKIILGNDTYAIGIGTYHYASRKCKGFHYLTKGRYRALALPDSFMELTVPNLLTVIKTNKQILKQLSKSLKQTQAAYKDHLRAETELKKTLSKLMEAL